MMLMTGQYGLPTVDFEGEQHVDPAFGFEWCSIHSIHHELQMVHDCLPRSCSGNGDACVSRVTLAQAMVDCLCQVEVSVRIWNLP